MSLRSLAFLGVVFVVLALVQSATSPLFVVREFGYLAQPFDPRGFAKSFIYLSAYVACAAATGAVFLQRSTTLRWLLLPGVALALAIDFFVQLLVSPRGFNEAEYALFVHEAGNFWRMIVFAWQVLGALGAAGLVVALLHGLAGRVPRTLSGAWLFALPASALLAGYSADRVDSIKTDAFPATVKIPTIAALHHLGARSAVPRLLASSIVTERPARVRDIIWIIDESVTGSYLSVNGYPKPTTPDLERHVAAGRISNFGVVNSRANCSALAHLLLRTGAPTGSGKSFADELREAPTIFQFARRAGFRTALYDAQAVHGEMQNYLTIFDLEDLDQYQTIDRSVLPAERDASMTRTLLEDLARRKDQSDFIVVVKYGAHWPYLLGYPPEKTLFTPVRSSTAERMSPETRERALNTYLNLLRYTVNDQLSDLLARLDLRDTAVFYTSDHGQSIVEPGSSITHCGRNNPPSSQADVPLMLLGEEATSRFPVRKGGIYSQAQIFPTTLALMGYGADVSDAYGPTLETPLDPGEKRWFIWSPAGERSPFEPPGPAR